MWRHEEAPENPTSGLLFEAVTHHFAQLRTIGVSEALFVYLQVANLVDSSADAMAFIAGPWLVLELTSSALTTGVIATVAAITPVEMSPLAG